MSDEKSDNPKMSLEKEYEIALATRNIEISLFWQRSNYFLVLNGALAVGFFRIKDSSESVLLALVGIFASFLWYRVNLGSKFWQSRWEHRLKIKEGEINSQLNYFAADWETIKQYVQNSLSNPYKPESRFRQWLNSQILEKPSVSENMIQLSLVFVAIWGLMLLGSIFS